MARLKLAIFWIKHQDRTMHKIGVIGKPLMKVTLDTILTLKTQKHLEDEWRSGNKVLQAMVLGTGGIDIPAKMVRLHA